MKTPVLTVLGYYYCFFENISYSCPSLRLFGYSTERSLRAAVVKMVRMKEAKGVRP